MGGEVHYTLLALTPTALDARQLQEVVVVVVWLCIQGQPAVISAGMLSWLLL